MGVLYSSYSGDGLTEVYILKHVIQILRIQRDIQRIPLFHDLTLNNE